MSNDSRLLTDDRPCRRCGASLHGVPIERDPELDVFIVACPRCGEHFAPSTYPALNTLVHRWKVLGMIAWALAWAAITLATVAASTGMTIGFTIEGVDRHRRVLFDDYAAWLSDREQIATTVGWNTTRDFEVWWVERGERVLAGMPMRSFVELDEMMILLVPYFDIFALSLLLSVVMWPLSRKRLLAMTIPFVALMGFGLVCAWIIVSMMPIATVDGISSRHALLPFVTVTLCGLLVPAIAGLLLGRPLCRWLIRLVLPASIGRTLLGPSRMHVSSSEVDA